MASLKGTVVILRKPTGDVVTIQDPDGIDSPSESRPYWSVVKDGREITTTGEIWVEKQLSGTTGNDSDVLCEDSVVCTGLECRHRTPHVKDEKCGQFCERINRVTSCNPYRIGF